MTVDLESQASTKATAANKLHLEGDRPSVNESSSIGPEVVLESHVSYEL